MGSADLSDPRRTRRLIKVVEDLAAQPTVSVPEACAGDWAAIKGVYRFFDSEAVSPAAIRAAHQGATIERSRCHPLILAMQDTTELTFTDRETVSPA